MPRPSSSRPYPCRRPQTSACRRPSRSWRCLLPRYCRRRRLLRRRRPRWPLMRRRSPTHRRSCAPQALRRMTKIRLRTCPPKSFRPSRRSQRESPARQSRRRSPPHPPRPTRPPRLPPRRRSILVPRRPWPMQMVSSRRSPEPPPSHLESQRREPPGFVSLSKPTRSGRASHTSGSHASGSPRHSLGSLVLP